MDKLLQAQFEKALEKMPNEFTSKAFCEECRKLGTPQRYIQNGGTRKFLLLNCFHNDFQNQRSWTKKKEVNKTLFDDLPNSCMVITDSGITDKQHQELIEQSIQILKNAGYKILMPKTTFKEI
jgi:hypothetical protein